MKQLRIGSYIYNQLLIWYYKMKVGKNFRCEGKLIVQGHGKYVIGNDVYFISNPIINPIGGGRIVLQTIGNGEIIIGDQVGMSHAILSAREKIIIENNVQIGAGTKILDHDFHSLKYKERMQTPDNNVAQKEVLIKEGAFVGTDCIILKGVTIGKYSVVGAGAVVTKDIPDNEVWAGNPARFIKSLEEC